MYSNNDFRSYSELRHYGIQGQKWGVRRYQNEDGSLTAAGKERYGSWDGHKKTYRNPDGTLTEEGKKKRQRIVTTTKVASALGLAAGGAAGLAAGVAADVGFTAMTGIIAPFLQLQVVGASTLGGAAIVSDIIQKIGDKRLDDFDMS